MWCGRLFQSLMTLTVKNDLTYENDENGLNNLTLWPLVNDELLRVNKSEWCICTYSSKASNLTLLAKIDGIIWGIMGTCLAVSLKHNR